MSRVARNPIEIPSGVTVNISGNKISINGPKGKLEDVLHHLIEVEQADNQLQVKAKNSSKFSKAMSGTTRANINNHVIGVTNGFTVNLELVGVGYRAAAQGKKLKINVGYSHEVIFELPEGVAAETPKATSIVLTGCNKQKVTQVAADIRDIRPPENYKGKGIRYADEHIIIKETKKK